MKTVEQIREEIAGALNSKCPNPVLLFEEKFRKDIFLTLTDYILAIEVGGEVVEKCLRCKGVGAIGGGVKSKNVYGLAVCSFCSGTGKLTRPKTLKDLLEAK